MKLKNKKFHKIISESLESAIERKCFLISKTQISLSEVETLEKLIEVYSKLGR